MRPSRNSSEELGDRCPVLLVGSRRVLFLRLVDRFSKGARIVTEVVAPLGARCRHVARLPRRRATAAL